MELSSSNSLQISLEAIRRGTAGLSKHRRMLLKKVPKTNDYDYYPYQSIQIVDLAYLSAKAGDEFALLRGKNNDILLHGSSSKCVFDDELVALLKQGKYELIAHSHPDSGRIIPSFNDRLFLKEIGQKQSIIISWYTGKTLVFTDNEFEDIHS